MPRKRFHLSLYQDLNADDSVKPPLQSHVVFTLVPEGINGMYHTAHPVIYKVWDLRYNCFTELGVCTARKDSSGHIIPVNGRIVPGGEYAALIRQGGSTCWTETRKWQDADTFDSILVKNDSNTPQAFALCLPIIQEDEYEPTLHPVLLFNQIGHEEFLRIRVHVKLQAWYSGTIFENGKQVKDIGKLVPLVDENNKPWTIDIKEQPFTSSWSIQQRADGKIRIQSADNRKSERMQAELRGDLQKLARDVKELNNRINVDNGITIEDRIRELEKSVEVKGKEVDGLRIAINTTNEETKTSASNLTTGIAALNSQFGDVDARLMHTNATVQSLEAFVKADHDDKAAWRSGLNDVKSMLEACEGKVTMLQSSVKQMRARVEKAESSIKEMMEEMG
ncbi:hypothetical protein NLI96_g8802 [Meripilus lineatus]|uniref:Uncharacterized protein n=1 Tax=Meripilus lineatus TaxID=2056292 RepID=A0AAD5UYA3_9APHY|nr:hypothetical protein NLI96_g8802 [Physisporinus lineatus]